MEIGKKELLKIYKRNKLEYSKYLPEYNADVLQRFITWAIDFKISPIYSAIPNDIIINRRMSNLYFMREMIKHHHCVAAYVCGDYDSFKMELFCDFVHRGNTYFMSDMTESAQDELISLYFSRKSADIRMETDQTCIFVKTSRLINNINKYYPRCSRLWEELFASMPEQIQYVREKIRRFPRQDYYYNLYINSPAPELVDLFDYDTFRRFRRDEYNKYMFDKYLAMVNTENFEENKINIRNISNYLGDGIINSSDSIDEFVLSRLI
jgi:hypothetical protein